MSATVENFVKSVYILALSCLMVALSNAKLEQIASELQAEKFQAQKCMYDLKKLWHTEVGHSPFAAVPLLADVDANGELDIVAAPFTETLTVLQAETGDTLPNSSWPVSNFLYSMYATPVQFDVDGDGMLDLLFTTFSGEVLFYKYDGVPLPQYTFQIPSVHVKRNWYQTIMSVSSEEIKDYIWIHEGQPDEAMYISIDAHVLATPVLIDMNQDDRIDEFVIPVSYFLDDEDYRFEMNGTSANVNRSSEVNNYLVSGVVVVNLTTQQVLMTRYFELTQMNGQFPAFVLSSPTVINLDSDHGDLEIILPTSAGSIHVLNSAGERYHGFPYTESSIHGQVTVADVNGDGRLELIAYDTGGLLVCISNHGNKIWEAEVSSASTAGSRVADVNGDGILDVVVATSDGKVFALNGTDGAVLPRWPIALHSQVTSNVLFTRLRLSEGLPDMVVLSNGMAHIISGDQSCQARLPVGEMMLVEALACDAVQSSRGLELLLAASHGALVMLGSGLPPAQEGGLEEAARRAAHLYGWPGSTRTSNIFTFGLSQPSVYVLPGTRLLKEATGTTFSLQFEIVVGKPHKAEFYDIKVYFGRNLLVKERYRSPGTYILNVPVWHHPAHGHVTVVMTNQHGMVSVDTFPLRFNQLILQDLQWLVIASFIGMIVILLVNYGYPAKDLLPVTFPSKAK